MDKNTLFVKKAQSTGDVAVRDVVISVTQTLPPATKDAMSLEQLVQLFDDQAKAIEGALYDSLPGGTYDRLLGRMLQRKASHFIVSHWSPARREADAQLIIAAPDLLNACQMGDSLGNEGPVLLEYAADVIEPFAPVTAVELRRKAGAERNALIKAETEATNA